MQHTTLGIPLRMFLWHESNVSGSPNSVYAKQKVDQKQPLVSCTRYLTCHWNTHKGKKSPYLAHYLDVGDPPPSSFALLFGQNGQNKVSRFGQRHSDQEGPRLVSSTEQLLCIWAGQVTMVPPGFRKTHVMMQPLHISKIFIPWANFGLVCDNGSLLWLS